MLSPLDALDDAVDRSRLVARGRKFAVEFEHSLEFSAHFFTSLQNSYLYYIKNNF
jgi:hypothetical protein